MNLKKLEESLDLISNSLEDLQKRRELLLKNSRDAISLSAKAIVAMHTNDMKLAQNRLKDVRKLLRELRIIAKRDLRRYLVSPETEYVEAEVLFAIINNRPIPSRKSLSVCDSSYLLGILDAIGEVKRLILDRIREGRSEVASELFSTAENLYILISPFAAYDRVADGTKRKLDVARKLIEGTRAIVTEEKRRAVLVRRIESLSNEIEVTK